MRSRRPRLLLVTPPYHAGVVEAAGVWMPLQHVCLAGAARAAGADVEIYDAMSRFDTHDDIAREIERRRPTMVALTSITAMEPDARRVCRTAKRIDSRILTIMGGVHPTFCWRQLLADEPAVDVVVRGEGERTIADLVRARAAGAGLGGVAGIAYRRDGAAVATPARPLMDDLDAVERAWDLVDWSMYYYRPHPEGRMAIIDSSRGCNRRCSFCSQHRMWEQTWRSRSPESLVGEIELLRDRYDARVVLLSDETPTVDGERWERILDLLIERRVGVRIMMETRVDDILRDERIMDKYVAAGMDHIYLGVEAGDQRTLDLYNKETRVEQGRRAIELVNQHGMISETSFVLGAPGDTAESIARTVEIAQWYAPDMAFFLALTPWPYADLYPALRDHIAVTDYSRYNLVEPIIEPDAMTLDEVRTALNRATGHFFRDKFERLDALPDHKRSFMIDVLKLLIEHSYLGAEMHAMASHATMPPSVRRMLDTLGIDLEDLSA